MAQEKQAKERLGSRSSSSPNLSEDTGNGSQKEPWKCEICRTAWSPSNDKMVECEFCALHYCIKCLRIKASEYTAIANTNCMWFCPPCKIKVEKQIVTEKEIEGRCEAYMAGFNDKIKELEQKIDCKCDRTEVPAIVSKYLEDNQYCKQDEIKAIVQHEITNNTNNKTPNPNNNELVKELKDSANREPNIVIYNMPEPNTNLKDEVIKQDLGLLTKLCDEICKIPFDAKTDITKIIRLGKKVPKPEDAGPEYKEKNRPVLVSFAHVTKKEELMGTLGVLKEAEVPFSQLGISHDMSKQERENNKKLLNEAKRLSDEEQGNWVYKVRGPPWNLKIVKIKKS